MKKILSVGLAIALLIVSAVVINFTSSQNVKSMSNLVVNNNLEKYGVTIIASTNSNFDSELTAYLKDNQKAVNPYYEAVKPFALFVKNTSSKDIVGISLSWEIKNADGSVQTFPQTELAPNRLMGFKPRNPITRGSLIPSNSSRFFALDSSVKSLIRNESQTVAADRPSRLTEQRLKQLEEYLPELQNKTRETMNRITNISISIDGIFFDDGTFLGADQNYLFSTMKSSIQVRKDFINQVREAVKAKKGTQEIFNWFESLAATRPESPEKFNSEAENYEYNYKIELYYSAKQALLKKQRWSESEIIEKITTTQTDNSSLLRKEAL